MIERVTIENFGPIETLDWHDLSTINLIIGPNSSGKTCALKAMFCMLRSLEEARGDEPRSFKDILNERLFWTFQANRFGELVRRNGKNTSLRCSLRISGQEVSYHFGARAQNKANVDGNVKDRDANSLFLPAKEVLSLHNVILKSREEDRSLGFDDTYFDLAKSLQRNPTRGKNYQEFATSRKALQDCLDGKVSYDRPSGSWVYQSGKDRYPIGMTAEGIKKISILDTLLGNRYLTRDSIVFMDEPEAALHPTSVARLLEIVSQLASGGMQFFLASHSYFVIKKLALIARAQKLSIPVMSFQDGAWTAADLKDGLPKNPIIDEAVQLYDEDLNLTFTE